MCSIFLLGKILSKINVPAEVWNIHISFREKINENGKKKKCIRGKNGIDVVKHQRKVSYGY
jgi:hypothetical protein